MHRPVRGARRVVPGGAEEHAVRLPDPRDRPCPDQGDPGRDVHPVGHHLGQVPEHTEEGAEGQRRRRRAPRRRAERGRGVGQGRLRPGGAHAPLDAAGVRAPEARGDLRHEGVPLGGLQLPALGLQPAVQQGRRHEAHGVAERVRRDLRHLLRLQEREDRPPLLRPEVGLHGDRQPRRRRRRQGEREEVGGGAERPPQGRGQAPPERLRARRRPPDHPGPRVPRVEEARGDARDEPPAQPRGPRLGGAGGAPAHDARDPRALRRPEGPREGRPVDSDEVADKVPPRAAEGEPREAQVRRRRCGRSGAQPRSRGERESCRP
mmetsp:Transcript_112710/g.319260  ORF Transcript_112710/g.319260 Transcript_112710/m.319260 type:complete len:320 (-) Transcript_112710:284-1243(-)